MTNPKHTDTSRSDDLVERLRDLAGKFEGQGGKHYTAALFGECADRIEELASMEECLTAELGDADARIEALEAENERLIGELADTKAEYHRVSEVSLELAKDKARLREALEQFLSLIEYQYCGSREAMNALQEADNFACAALEGDSHDQ